MNTRKLNLIALAVIFALLNTTPLTLAAKPAPATQPETPIPRTILAFYNPNPHNDPFFTDIHQAAEVVLNHLGLKVVFWSITAPLPDDTIMTDVRGILTWFNGHGIVKNPQQYCSWLNTQMQQGIKLVMLGHFGFTQSNQDPFIPECKAMFKSLGAEFLGEYSNDTYFFNIEFQDKQMTGFEHHINLADRLTYSLIKVTDPAVKPHLKINRADLDDSSSALVFTSPQGGFVYDSYVLKEDVNLGKRHWIINPFAFFATAFDTQGLPKPDTNTINGTRIFYNHIDGDSPFNISHIDGKSFSIEIILEEIYKKYTSIPITTTLVTAYLDLEQYKTERIDKIYQTIFSLPHIEPASHGHAHPFNWKKGVLAFKIPGYEFTPKSEMLTSYLRITLLLQKLNIPKKIRLFTWTGDCFPSHEHITAVDQLRIQNINGGDSRFDRQYDSYAYVAPLGMLKNNALQVYASNSNEYTYTNKWTGPFYGFKLLKETLANTESPVRIKPINIYYHYYSGENTAALIALKENYEYALSQEIFPIQTSAYPPIVHDFFDTKIFKLPGGDLISNKGALRTIRYDNETRNVDMSRSTGVIGFKHYQGSLYVSLDETTQHRIFLTEKKQDHPYVIDASFDVKNFTDNNGTISFLKKGWHKSKIRLGGLVPQRDYRVTTPNESINATATDEGVLEINFKTAENEKDSTPVRITY
ncbi:MAG: hypothetical protein HQM16_15935 [Deltaproteobacteria bacterium]|nr:hypothetical protein [Deltaproteobacteria bacterium]